MVTISDIQRQRRDIQRSLQGDRGSSARQKRDALRQLDLAERYLREGRGQSTARNVLKEISKKAIYGGRQRISRTTAGYGPNKAVIIRDKTGRVIDASQSVKQKVPNIVGKRISQRQSQLITGGISGAVTKKQAETAIATQRYKALEQSRKAKEIINASISLRNFIRNVENRINRENITAQQKKEQQQVFLNQLYNTPLETLANKKGKSVSQIERELKDRIDYLNRPKIRQARLSGEQISQTTENFERLFKRIPGLKSDTYLSKAARDALAFPSRQTVGFALTVAQGSRNVRLLQQDLLSKDPKIREQAKKQLKSVSKQVPNVILQGLNPKDPEGLVNLVALSTLVLAPFALRRIIKTKTPKSNTPESLKLADSVIVDTSTGKASVIDAKGNVIAVSKKSVNISLFKKIRDRIKSTAAYEKVIKTEQKILAKKNRAAQKLGFKDFNEQILFNALEKSAKTSKKASNQLKKLETKIIKRDVDKKITQLDKRIAKSLPEKLKKQLSRRDIQTNKIFDKIEKSLSNIKKREVAAINKSTAKTQKLGFKNTTEFKLYQDLVDKVAKGSKIALQKLQKLETKIIKRTIQSKIPKLDQLILSRIRKYPSLSQREIIKLINKNKLSVKIKPPKARTRKNTKTKKEKTPTLNELSDTFLKKNKAKNKKILSNSNNQISIKKDNVVYQLDLQKSTRKIYKGKEVSVGETKQIVYELVSTKNIKPPKIKTKNKVKNKTKKTIQRASITKSLPIIKQVFIAAIGAGIGTFNSVLATSILQSSKFSPIVIVQPNVALTPLQKNQIKFIFGQIPIQKVAVVQDVQQYVKQLNIEKVISKGKKVTKKITETTRKPKILGIPLSKLSWRLKPPKGYEYRTNYAVRIGGKARLFKVGKTFHRTLNEAIKRVDTTTARSFQVIISGITKTKDIKKPSLRKFRLRKGKDPRVLIFVEKSKYAIDSPGEKIGLRGKNVKRKKKKANKRVSKKATKKRKKR